jgi:hypothetical protein
MAVFLDVAPSCLVDTDRSFGGTCCLHHHPDDKESKLLWNVDQYLLDYTEIFLNKRTKEALRQNRNYDCYLLCYTLKRRQQVRQKHWKLPALLRRNPEDNNLIFHCREHLKSHPENKLFEVEN